MLAAVVSAAGEVPGPRDAPEPLPGPGQAMVEVDLAGVNPVDLAIASGRFYAATPAPPFTAGAEAVGRIIEASSFARGTRVWALTLTGALAERVAVDESALVRVPDGVSDRQAVLAGIAGLAGWMATRERGDLAPGETVAVLGASGVAGQVAIQAARARGAGLVVGVARSEAGRARALRAGADRALSLDADDLARDLRDAADGGVDLVVDGLWGAAAAAAILALAPGGRLVQVGNSMDPQAMLSGGPFRGGRLDLRGFSVFSEARRARAASYGELARAIAAAVVVVPVEEHPLGAVSDIWTRQAAGAGGVKLAVRPGG